MNKQVNKQVILMMLIVFRSRKNKGPLNMSKHIAGAVSQAKNPWLLSSQAQEQAYYYDFAEMSILPKCILNL